MYKTFANRWYIYDNTYKKYSLIAEGDSTGLSVDDNEMFKIFMEVVNEK